MFSPPDAPKDAVPSNTEVATGIQKPVFGDKAGEYFPITSTPREEEGGAPDLTEETFKKFAEDIFKEIESQRDTLPEGAVPELTDEQFKVIEAKLRDINKALLGNEVLQITKFHPNKNEFGEVSYGGEVLLERKIVFNGVWESSFTLVSFHGNEITFIHEVSFLITLRSNEGNDNFTEVVQAFNMNIEKIEGVDKFKMIFNTMTFEKLKQALNTLRDVIQFNSENKK